MRALKSTCRFANDFKSGRDLLDDFTCVAGVA